MPFAPPCCERRRYRRPPGRNAEKHERRLWKPRDQREKQHHAAGNGKHARIGKKLCGDLSTQIAVRCGAAHQNAGAGGNHERRDLGHETIADGEPRIRGERGHGIHPQHGHADDEPADDIDKHNNDAGDGVAANEFRGAVHGPVKIRLARYFLAALPRLVLGDEPGIEVGVDRHLFAGHGIEGEPRGHFGNAALAFGDDHELDDDEDDKYDDADDDIALCDERSEHVHHMPGVGLGQDEPRRGDVERQPEQGDRKQKRREHRKIKRLPCIHGHEQNYEGKTEAEAEQNVQQEGGQRYDHDDQNAYHAEHDDQVALLRKGLDERRVQHIQKTRLYPDGVHTVPYLFLIMPLYGV